MTAHDACHKEGPISALEVTTSNIEKKLTKMDGTMERFIGVLEQISAQNQQIISLQASVKRIDDSNEDHGKRLNVLEVALAKDKVRIGFLMGGASALSALGTTVVDKLFK